MLWMPSLIKDVVNLSCNLLVLSLRGCLLQPNSAMATAPATVLPLLPGPFPPQAESSSALSSRQLRLSARLDALEALSSLSSPAHTLRARQDAAALRLARLERSVCAASCGHSGSGGSSGGSSSRPAPPPLLHTSPALFRLVGHLGSILGVRWAQDEVRRGSSSSWPMGPGAGCSGSSGVGSEQGGTRLLSVSDDRTARVWNLDLGLDSEPEPEPGSSHVRAPTHHLQHQALGRMACPGPQVLSPSHSLWWVGGGESHRVTHFGGWGGGGESHRVTHFGGGGGEGGEEGRGELKPCCRVGGDQIACGDEGMRG